VNENGSRQRAHGLRKKNKMREEQNRDRYFMIDRVCNVI
jgi:hypothetical protein